MCHNIPKMDVSRSSIHGCACDSWRSMHAHCNGISHSDWITLSEWRCDSHQVESPLKHVDMTCAQSPSLDWITLSEWKGDSHQVECPLKHVDMTCAQLPSLQNCSTATPKQKSEIVLSPNPCPILKEQSPASKRVRIDEGTTSLRQVQREPVRESSMIRVNTKQSEVDNGLEVQSLHTNGTPMIAKRNIEEHKEDDYSDICWESVASCISTTKTWLEARKAAREKSTG